MRRRAVKGAVLLTTIITVSTLAILVLSLMQAVLLYTKASSHVVINHHAFYQLEVAALKIAGKNTPLVNCLVKNVNPNQLVSQLLQRDGCVLNMKNHRYYYLINDLGEHPCLHILHNKEILGSHHWLVSIASSKGAVLQLRIIKRAKTPGCKQTEERQIHEGISSWRYLPA